MAQHGPRGIVRRLAARADLHRPIPVLVARLVRHDLVAIELEDCARGALPRLRIVERRHAAFRAQEARAEGRRVRFSLQR